MIKQISFHQTKSILLGTKVGIVRGQVSTPVSYLLEYGCGIGRNMPFLRIAFPDALVIGSDFSATSLGLARHENPDIEFVHAVVAHVAFEATLPGWASIPAGVMLISGVQLFALGIAGAYIAKICEETKARPLYIIREAHGVAALEAPFQTADRLRLHQLDRISGGATR